MIGKLVPYYITTPEMDAGNIPKILLRKPSPLIPLVLMPTDGTSVVSHGFSYTSAAIWAERVQSVFKRPWIAASWCFDPNHPGSVPLNDPAMVMRNIEALGRCLRLNNGAGFILDAEYYPATPNQSGGPMPEDTWTGDVDYDGIGEEMSRNFKSMILGVMSWSMELNHQIGLRMLIDGMTRGQSKGTRFLFAEDYVGPNAFMRVLQHRKARKMGLTPLRGVDPMPQYRATPGHWIYDPSRRYKGKA